VMYQVEGSGVSLFVYFSLYTV